MGRRSPFTEQQKKFIADNYQHKSNKELTELLNARFGTNFGFRQVKGHKQRRGLTRTNLYYTEEQKNFVRQNAKGVRTEELTAMFNARFKTNVTVTKMLSLRYRLGARSGLIGSTGPNAGSFKKGHTPFNKGKRREEYVSKESIEKSRQTQFKPGHVPYNTRPVGSERLDADGYIRVKTAEPRTWTLKHRLIWEKEHGPIPKGQFVTFLDGNKLNCSIDNLYLITKAENALLMRHKLRYKHKELTRAGVLITKIITTAKRKAEGAG